MEILLYSIYKYIYRNKGDQCVYKNYKQIVLKYTWFGNQCFATLLLSGHKSHR